MKRFVFGSAVVLAIGFVAACATMKAPPDASLRVECNVPDALVLLDDALVGKAGDLATKQKSVRPGFYRVELRHPGYYPHFTEITLGEGAGATVKAELHPLLD